MPTTATMTAPPITASRRGHGLGSRSPPWLRMSSIAAPPQTTPTYRTPRYVASPDAPMSGPATQKAKDKPNPQIDYLEQSLPPGARLADARGGREEGTTRPVATGTGSATPPQRPHMDTTVITVWPIWILSRFFSN